LLAIPALLWFQVLLYAKSTLQTGTAEKLEFSVTYKSINPVEIHKAVFYFSSLRHSVKQDSIICLFHSNDLFVDTFSCQTKWRFPVYVRIRFECTDGNRMSNEFYYYPGIRFWNIMVFDTTLKVQSKNVLNFSHPYKPLVGLILLIQTVVELIIAIMMSLMIGWSRAVWVMVLAANIATFPIYVLTFKHLWIRELLVLLIKTFVMSVIGYRRIHFYKIVLFAITLSFVSFGLKEILFIIMRIM